MTTNPFAEQGAFAPEATVAMGEAFDAACEELRDEGDLQLVRKLLTRIMHDAMRFRTSFAQTRAIASTS